MPRHVYAGGSSRGDLNDELAVLRIKAVENGRDADGIKAGSEIDPSGRAPNQVIFGIYGEVDLASMSRTHCPPDAPACVNVPIRVPVRARADTTLLVRMFIL